MTYVLLGKTGDTLAFLPVLWHEAQTGQKPRLMVSKRYANVLDGVSYVDPIIFDGEPHELDRAMEQARKLDPNAVCVQTAGPPEIVRKWTYGGAGKTTRSFVREMWQLAGHGPLWREDPPLVIDRRRPEHEALLLAKFPQNKRGVKKYRCLMHLDGKTSPFPHAQLLRKLIQLAFPKWEVIDLGTVRSERIYDFLGLYETADLGIFCDSAFLHLARAVPCLPVVALTKDTPVWWHGSAWRPQYFRYCRYSDFPARAANIVEQLKEMHFVIRGMCPTFQMYPILHVWSEAEMDDKYPPPWHTEVGVMQNCGIEIGSCGRDSGTVLKDGSRFPFLRDVLAMGCMKAKVERILCLSRVNTTFPPGLIPKIENEPLSYAKGIWCFPKKWWQEHQTECPDLIMGLDDHWPTVLTDLLKKHGAKAL